MKTIKKSVISIVLALVMIAMPVGDTLALTPVYADTTVYVTRTGSKYHTTNVAMVLIMHRRFPRR